MTESEALQQIAEISKLLYMAQEDPRVHSRVAGFIECIATDYDKLPLENVQANAKTLQHAVKDRKRERKKRYQFAKVR